MGDDVRQKILDAFGVTEDEMAQFAGLDRATEEARAIEAHHRDVVIPERVRAVEAKINATLPEGFEVRFS